MFASPWPGGRAKSTALNQASNVISCAMSSEGLSGTPTKSSTPSKSNPVLNFPGTQDGGVSRSALEMSASVSVPSFALPELSAAVVSIPSSKCHRPATLPGLARAT